VIKKYVSSILAIGMCLTLISGCGNVDELARRKQAKSMLASFRKNVDLNGRRIPDSDHSFVIIGVYGMRDPDELAELISSDQVQWPCILGDLKIKRAWGFSIWPANVLIDQHGVVQVVNEFDEAELTHAIEALAEQDAAN